MTAHTSEKKDDENTQESEEAEKAELEQYIKEFQERLTAKQELRATNQNAQNIRPPESSFSKLDSNVKRNTSFVKKIKNFTANQLETYIKDMSGLNLSKYISEVAAGLVDAKLKMTDVYAVVKLSSLLNQTYGDFSQLLFENWQKNLSIKPGDKIANPSKLRVDLRLYADLVQAGIFNKKILLHYWVMF